MLRKLGALVAGATICAVGLLSAHAQETKKSEKAEIPGGIEGTNKGVDKDKGTVSVLTSEGRTRTFTVSEDTTILGARGGKVRGRLNDRRFREGLDITVVATGTTAKELHLGIYRSDPGESTEKPKTAAKRKTRRQAEEEKVAEAAKVTSKKAAPKAVAETAAKSVAAEDEDDDNEIVGKVKSYDTTSGRHLLVVTLLNGKGRPFFLSKEVKVLVKGKETKEGLLDPSIKSGTPVTVLTDSGGRKVLELHVGPPTPAPSKSTSKSKKAA
jgi:hypothetical protein